VLFTHYGKVIGDDLATYRNHVYRSLTYQQWLLGRNDVSNDMALAWAVHDLGIWTAGTFDYIPPSADLARKHAAEAGVENLPVVVEGGTAPQDPPGRESARRDLPSCRPHRRARGQSAWRPEL